ncbi:uncharacterized protein LOC122066440 isoform X1 [Macadamia integrifolia]|uniref:uncharacterized protein LOC122066440 isoform X1 n=1 Tax=Macadamia integrifolia TaxID=60698 RepID=UPI001C4EA407|nr:uncharacterized protein LOC122066440 isoform X1 [Macadamia integrifolia]
MTAGVLFSRSFISLATKPSPSSAYSLSSRQLCHGSRGDAFKFKSINSSRSRCSQDLITVRRIMDGEFGNLATTLPSCLVLCKAQKVTTDEGGDSNGIRRQALQLLLWAVEGVYILWLFLLPYAPGDPVWAISLDTVNSLVGLSLNFFFILPLMNYVGIHAIEAPILHPVRTFPHGPLGIPFLLLGRLILTADFLSPFFCQTSEGLFNFVLGWTFMFAPLLFKDCKRDRYKGSLEVLWGLQMFLTNTFLIPYMAIRLNEVDAEYAPGKPSQMVSVMTNGATVVGLVGGVVCLVSILWSLFGRMDGDFGNVTERWDFLISYLGSERLAYAFIWDICLYIIFQPWLIGDNLQNVQQSKASKVSKLRFIPVVGLVAYLLSLDIDIEV